MDKASLQALKEILSANQRFYEAFASGDVQAMDQLWSSNASVICIHPGWPAILDRDEMMESWKQILSHPDGNSIRCIHPRVFGHGEMALVACQEVFPGGVLVATNGYIREDGTWRLIHHQASPLSAGEEPATTDTSN